MTLSPNLLARLVGAAVAAAVGAGAGVAAGSRHAASLEEKVERLVTDVQEMKGDLRFLKCVAGYPGDASAVVRCTAGSR